MCKNYFKLKWVYRFKNLQEKLYNDREYKLIWTKILVTIVKPAMVGNIFCLLQTQESMSH